MKTIILTAVLALNLATMSASAQADRPIQVAEYAHAVSLVGYWGAARAAIRTDDSSFRSILDELVSYEDGELPSDTEAMVPEQVVEFRNALIRYGVGAWALIKLLADRFSVSATVSSQEVEVCAGFSWG